MITDINNTLRAVICRTLITVLFIIGIARIINGRWQPNRALKLSGKNPRIKTFDKFPNMLLTISNAFKNPQQLRFPKSCCSNHIISCQFVSWSDFTFWNNNTLLHEKLNQMYETKQQSRSYARKIISNECQQFRTQFSGVNWKRACLLLKVALQSYNWLCNSCVIQRIRCSVWWLITQEKITEKLRDTK